MSQRFHRRRKLNFSIKRAFQLRLILRVLMIAMAALVLAVIGFGLYSNREISGSFIHGDIQVRNFFELLLPAAIGIVSVGTIVALSAGVFAGTVGYAYLPAGNIWWILAAVGIG